MNRMIKNNKLLSCKNLSENKIMKILQRTEFFEKKPGFNNQGYQFTLVNAFFEPSTRTMLSFQQACYRLGGKVINFNKEISSINKGESHYDTVKSLINYGDIMVLRHPEKGFVERISEKEKMPIINGGDGDGEHPTQALLDLYTIYKNFKPFFTENAYILNILIVGDIKHSRTIHSLIDVLKHYSRIKINLLPYDNREPNYEMLLNISKDHNQFVDDIVFRKEDCDYSKYDIIYMTRLQKERHAGTQNVNFILNKEEMKKIKEKAIIMHPLPRNEEISTEIDDDERCVYFDQAKNGVYVRMSIIEMLLGYT